MKVKYLGIVISSSLSWDKQVNNVMKKIRAVLYQLKLCRHLLPESFRIRLVVAVVLPHLNYCCAAFTDMMMEQDVKLRRAIRACLRFVYGVRWDDHITSYYVRARWLQVTLEGNILSVVQYS